MAVCDPLSWLSCICLEGLMELSREALLAAADRAEKCPEIFVDYNVSGYWRPEEIDPLLDIIYFEDDGLW